MNVVVVESPAKAKTINKYLGSGYEVLASFGHVRDLPAKNGSVDPDQDFHMIWEVDAKAQKRLADIARAVKGADKLILATDPDREGEAISWHVLEVLKEKHALKGQKIERVVFNAITKQSVIDAMKNPRRSTRALVDAYLARRALDYLVGFTLSPVLWRKLPGARSAGRVQSVALRLVCDRELEIEKFVAREYWSLVATLGDAAQRHLRGAPGRRRRQEDPAPRHRHRRRGRSTSSAIWRPRSSRVDLGRGETRASAIPRPRSRPRRCSRRRAASSASRPRTPCASRSGSMRASTSAARPSDSLLICAPTACSWRRRGDQRDPRRYRGELRQAIRAGRAAQLPEQAEERAGSPRSGAPDRPVEAPARCRQISRVRSGQALRAGLAARDREPDGIGRARAHHRRHRRQGRRPHHRPARDRHGDQVRRLPHALSGGRGRRAGGRGRQAPARDERRRGAGEARDRRHAAFHRAAAALLGSLAGQAHGRARHRPALDLCVDPAGAEGPQLRAAGEEAPLRRGQGPRRGGVPGELLRPLRRVRIHRRPGGGPRPHLQRRSRLARGAARLLARLHRRGRQHQGRAASAKCSTCSTRCWRRTCSRPARTAPIRASARPAATAGCRSSSASSAPSSAARTIRSAASPASSPPTARRAPTRCSARIPETGLDVAIKTGRFGTYLQLGEGSKERRSRSAPASRRAGRSTTSRWRARSSCSRCRARSARARRTASRSWPASGASAPTCSTARPTRTSTPARTCSRSASIARSR